MRCMYRPPGSLTALATIILSALALGCTPATTVGVRLVDPRGFEFFDSETSIANSTEVSAHTERLLQRADLADLPRRTIGQREVLLNTFLTHVGSDLSVLTPAQRRAAAELTLAVDNPLWPKAARSLEAAWLVWPLAHEPGAQAVAVDIHREATGRLLTSLAREDVRPGQVVRGTFDSYVVPRYELEAGIWFEDTQPDLVCRTDTFEITGVEHRYLHVSYGVPAMGYWESTIARIERHPFLPLEGSVAAMNGVLSFDDDTTNRASPLRPRLLLTTPDSRSIDVPDGFTASADWSAPMAYLMSIGQVNLRGVRGMTQTEAELDRFGLFLPEPYDPSRIPVVFVHGLRSSPLTWREVHAVMLGEEDLRDGYQSWFFMYPSGLPVLIAAERLRNDLEAVRDRYDPGRGHLASSDMIVVGHSMGGLLARTLVQRPGDRFWRVKRSGDLDDLELSRETREYIRRVFFFEPIAEISRVVFIATPLRGTGVASSWIGELATLMVSMPPGIRRKSLEFERASPPDDTPSGARPWRSRVPTSIEVLEPDDPYMIAFNEVPVVDGVLVHTIIGDRGSRRTEQWPQGTSDGVVPYWSSRYGTAESELVLQSGHDVHQNPQAVAEIVRILRLHAAEHVAANCPEVESERAEQAVARPNPCPAAVPSRRAR